MTESAGRIIGKTGYYVETPEDYSSPTLFARSAQPGSSPCNTPAWHERDEGGIANERKAADLFVMSNRPLETHEKF